MNDELAYELTAQQFRKLAELRAQRGGNPHVPIGMGTRRPTCRRLTPLVVRLATAHFQRCGSLGEAVRRFRMGRDTARAIRDGRMCPEGLAPIDLDPGERRGPPVRCRACGALIEVVPCRACRARAEQRRARTQVA